MHYAVSSKNSDKSLLTAFIFLFHFVKKFYRHSIMGCNIHFQCFITGKTNGNNEEAAPKVFFHIILSC
jgi:hypothetical protein